MFRILVILLLINISTPVYAQALLKASQTDSEKKTEETNSQIKDKFNRDTPRSTTEAFLAELAKQDYEAAGNYINNKSKKKKSADIAQLLNKALDQAGKITPTSLISDKPEGNLEDKLLPEIERIGDIRTTEKNIDLFLERMTPEDKTLPAYWVISADTIKEVNSIKSKITSSLINNNLPSSMIKNELWGVPVGHWLALIMLAFTSYMVMWAVSNAVLHLVYYLKNTPKENRCKDIYYAFLKPLQLYFAVILFTIVGNYIGVSIVARQNFGKLGEIAAWIALAWIAWRLIDVFTEEARKRLLAKGQYSVLSAAYFLRRMLKITLFIIVTISVLDSFGFKVTTWLAALGLGGLAIALGAQKSVENFVGSLTLITDRPISIGDFCKFGTTKGTVEDIGMRSTRIRTPERTIVTIPNGDFVSMQIENLTRRDSFLYNPILKLSYETTPEQIRFILLKIRAFLNDFDKIDQKGMRVNFLGLAESSINIDVIVPIKVKKVDESNEITEKVNLGILDIVRDSGTWFAYPPQTIYMAEKKEKNS